MSNVKLPAKPAKRASLVVRLAGLAISTGWVAFAIAGTSSATFAVSATSVSGSVSGNDPAGSGFCTTGPNRYTFGAVVVVVCGTGAVVSIKAPKTALPWTALHGGAYRYSHVLESEFRGAGLIDGIASYTGLGTITSWRLISLADRDYLEFQIGW